MPLIDKALKTRFLASFERLSEGQLTLHTPEGDSHRFGSNGPETELHIRDWSAISTMAAHGQVGVGEAYVQGLWDTSSIEGLMTLLLNNRDEFVPFDKPGALNKMRFRMVDTVLRSNSRRGAKKNIRAHYDVGNEFYSLWLDDTMTYSSGLFDADDESDVGKINLEEAQKRKYDRILSRLGKGDNVLEIGCGWGGFAEQAANEGRDVTGITISRNQHAYADSRLDGRADIELRDYRDIKGKYDSIVSIEMVEAVGERYWPNYFSTLKRRLADGGRAMLQVITIRDDLFDKYRTSSDFIRQYVFPGGMLLSDRVIAEQAKGAGLEVVDSFAFGQSYATTCRLWASQLVGQKNKILKLGHDEAFFRNWQYYLELCAVGFAAGQTDVVQVELAHR